MSLNAIDTMSAATAAVDALRYAFAGAGTVTVDSSSGLVTGDFYGIDPLETCKINSIVLKNGHTGDALFAGKDLTRFRVIRFTSIQLTSGSATLYKV